MYQYLYNINTKYDRVSFPFNLYITFYDITVSFLNHTSLLLYKLWPNSVY